jgi:hypothetical protein
MSPKYHPAPLSGGDRKALKKELSKSRAMTRIFADAGTVGTLQVLLNQKFEVNVYGI